MGQINYSQYEAEHALNNEQSKVQRPRIAYFALSNDGDEAIVRFMINDPSDFDIVDVHTATINGKQRKVNCIRDAKDDLSKCPFCEEQKPVQRRFYIHLLEYTRGENGEVIATPKIWERSSSYITTLKNLCQEYGPLSDNIFKIKRNGAPGSVDTTYSILFGNPNMYSSSVYKKDENAFKEVKALGTCVFDYSYDQLKNLLHPESQIQSTPSTSSSYSTTTDMASAYNASKPFDVSSDIPRPVRRY